VSWYYPKRGAKTSANGIKLQKSDKTGPPAWGQRWIDSIAQFTRAPQMERGLRIAKSGRVLSIQVDQGFATAEVQGTRSRPYRVEIGLPMFTRKQWMRVTDALLKKAFYSAKLLAGEMPLELEEIFVQAGAALIPTSEEDLSSDCSCTELDSPCTHIAATFFVLGQEIDRDPFLLLEMRGLGRAQLLAEMQTRRGSDKILKKKPATAPLPERPVQTLLSHRLNDFFRASPAPTTHAATSANPAAPVLKPGSRIHKMGAPPFWQSDNNFEDVLVRIYQAVRSRASNLG
jgi:uncharacterized Zn finger protein